MAIEHYVLMEDSSTRVTTTDLNLKLEKNIRIVGFYDHTKASEKYVLVRIGDVYTKPWHIPFYYRRTELFIDTQDDLISYILKVVPLLTQDNIGKFKEQYKRLASSIFGVGATVTIPIFMQLIENCGEWVCNKDFNSPNPQRRIQEIKENGFTIATKIEEKKTYHMILPFPKSEKSGYETFSTEVRNAIFSVHNNINAFTGEKVSSSSCLPDHKFPEIRWNHCTPVSNDNLSRSEMFAKFQIVPETINQAKREVCRRCFQTGLRGKLNGINYFYKGTEHWDNSIPKTGKESELGCVGCFWYDMLAWRKSLHDIIDRNK